MPVKAPLPVQALVPQLYDWSGFYIGAHAGMAWGRSNWSEQPDGLAGSLNMFQRYDAFTNFGSWFAGVQAGYDYMLPNRIVLGVQADVTAPSFQSLNAISIGGISTFVSPTLGQESYSETVLDMGTVRGRIGYAPGNWLFYATGGFAWTYDQLTVNQLANGGITDMPFLWRFGWVAGAGVELPLAPNWTAGLEYLYTRYGNSTVGFANAGQTFQSDLSIQQLRLTLNYRFVAEAKPGSDAASWFALPDDRFNVHGQTTFAWLTYPAMRSPYMGPNSLPGSGQGRETFDATLYAGVRLWQGAELWVNPELDQGFGFANTHGVAGFPSGESFKLGFSYPYARIERFFLRQTINLGGEVGKLDADINQFANTLTANRLVLTVGQIFVTDIFDTNKYANSSKTDFMNWSLMNAGTFDFAGNAWEATYGAVAEWYQGFWTLRGGIFDLSATPEGGISPTAIGLDSTFDQFQMVGEIEERHELWGQPGKFKITGFVSRGRAGAFAAAVDLAQLTGQPADITAVRTYTSRPGVSVNLEQQISDTVGIFARAGWADGNIEPWDFTDIDRTVSGGVSLNGKSWGRAGDTIGIAGAVNGISPIHQQFLNLGGLGILIGDGQLPNPGLEQIFETYYSYALTPASHLSFDYQFINNPAYNTQRGPVNVFGMRLHAQF
ncbi:MAG: carbohydrate porin [Xanthobacteraceae bacterium]|nr:carbohydrate porin [Xanthobacteraceae bacterium]